MKISVLGSGCWATALSHVFSKHPGTQIVLIGREESSFDRVDNINTKYFPDIVLENNISFTTDIKEGIKDSGMILFAVPSSAYVQTARKVAPLLDREVLILSAAKGFDPDTFVPLSETLKKNLPRQYVKGVVSLIGPSFAREVIHDQVTAVVATSPNEENNRYVQQMFSTSTFRIYTNQDEIGCQVGAALKNVLAIAGGIIAGLGQGENAKAALITRGLQEVIRLGELLGGKRETFFGLTGIGDLLLTSSSMESRNYNLGYQIGLADDAYSVLEKNTKTVEGVNACKYATILSKENHLDMPILFAVYDVLFHHVKPSLLLHKTMMRSLKSEQ